VYGAVHIGLHEQGTHRCAIFEARILLPHNHAVSKYIYFSTGVLFIKCSLVTREDGFACLAFPLSSDTTCE
jgi:hypothetical protein